MQDHFVCQCKRGDAIPIKPRFPSPACEGKAGTPYSSLVTFLKMSSILNASPPQVVARLEWLPVALIALLLLDGILARVIKPRIPA